MVDAIERDGYRIELRVRDRTNQRLSGQPTRDDLRLRSLQAGTDRLRSQTRCKLVQQ
jgi:hypothetical protein